HKLVDISHDLPTTPITLRYHRLRDRADYGTEPFTGQTHPDVLAAQRKERARIRSGKGLRRGGRTLTEAA
ncbi:hypothetical protein ACWGJO_41175, partial [Kitasatospora sp. NPDC054795]